jgi:hypothetical protein
MSGEADNMRIRRRRENRKKKKERGSRLKPKKEAAGDKQ